MGERLHVGLVVQRCRVQFLAMPPIFFHKNKIQKWSVWIYICKSHMTLPTQYICYLYNELSHKVFNISIL